MSNVLNFPQSPLTPFLGEWARDPISVSRNKVARRILGEVGLKKLWACGSMTELTQCLAADPELAEKHQALLRIGVESRMVVTQQTIAWNNAETASLPARTNTFQVVKVAMEGKKVIVDTIELNGARRGRRAGHVLRMNEQWLLVSEHYYGAQAQLFPPSPVFRYYRPS